MLGHTLVHVYRVSELSSKTLLAQSRMMLAHVVTSDRSSSGRQVVELQALILPLGVVL